MEGTVQNKTFTRYIYRLNYCSTYFNEFVLLNQIDLYSSHSSNRFELNVRVQIEPFKGLGGSRTRARLYFSKMAGIEKIDITGMRSTKYISIFFGDANFYDITGKPKKVLILFQIDKQHEELIVDIFDHYYPSTTKERIRTIDDHPYHNEKGTR